MAKNLAVCEGNANNRCCCDAGVPRTVLFATFLDDGLPAFTDDVSMEHVVRQVTRSISQSISDQTGLFLLHVYLFISLYCLLFISARKMEEDKMFSF